MHWTTMILIALGLGTLGLIGFILVKYVRITVNLFLDVLVTSRPGRHEVDGKPVRFRSLDGVGLSGVWLPARGRPRGTVVFCHEFGANGASVAEFGLFLRERFNLFTFDFRGHGPAGLSGGYRPHQCASTKEVYDVLGALAYARQRSGRGPLGLFGMSRGGSAAICAAARDPGVRALVVDGAFSTRMMLDTYMRRWISIYVNVDSVCRRLPAWVYAMVRELTILVSRLRLRRGFPSIRRAMRRLSRCAVLVIHGERDTWIEPAQAEALYAAAGEPKRLWIVPGARHNESATLAADDYRHRVTAFFTAYLGTAEEAVDKSPAAGREPAPETG